MDKTGLSLVALHAHKHLQSFDSQGNLEERLKPHCDSANSKKCGRNNFAHEPRKNIGTQSQKLECSDYQVIVYTLNR